MFRSADRLIWMIHDWREDVLTVWIAPCWEVAWQDQPAWTFLSPDDLLHDLGLPEVMTTIGALDRGARLSRIDAVLRGPLRGFVSGEGTTRMVAIAEARFPEGVPGRSQPPGPAWDVNETGDWLLVGRRHTETQLVLLGQTSDPDPMQRARAALGLQVGIPLGGARLRDVTARLLALLADPDPTVRRAAASSLGVRRKRGAFRPMLMLLDEEPGDTPSPIAVALVRLADALRPAEIAELRIALATFAARGPVATAQVAEISPWLDWAVRARLDSPSDRTIEIAADGSIAVVSPRREHHEPTGTR